MQYCVTMKVTGIVHVYVEADSPVDAETKAYTWDVDDEEPCGDYSDWEVVRVEENT